MTTTTDDFTLLERYASARDQAAFGELVRRHVDVVYSAAARRVGDRHTAEDVTQAVFMILAQKPSSPRPPAPLTAWLLTTTRYAAANAVKIDRRRRRREASLASDPTVAGAASSNPSDALAWQDIAAQLDDAVLKLPALDRRAVLLRYFEQKSVRDVAAVLQVTEAAAKQRLSRSLDKLRRRLTHAGLAPAAATASLAGLLTAHAVSAAPAGLASASATASVAATFGVAATTGSASFSIAKGALAMMTWTKIKAVAAIIAVATVVGTGAVVTVNRGVAQAQERAAAPAAPLSVTQIRAKAVTRVEAAKKVVDALELATLQGNEPLTAAVVEIRGAAHRRLADARIDAADEDPAARLRAAQDYLQQCRDLLAVLEKRASQDVTIVQLNLGRYQLADAEYLLAKVQVGR